MVKDIRLRHRRRMKQKEADPVLERLRDTFGMKGIEPGMVMDSAVADPGRYPVYLYEHDIIALEADEKICPTVRGLLKWPADKRWVTVDMGAIRFVTNGADTMAPGITDADPDIAPGDPVWIRDETHGKPLAVGVSTQTGPELKAGDKGKVVRAVHHLGDAIWDFGHE